MNACSWGFAKVGLSCNLRRVYSALFMILAYSICNTSIAPLRKEPSHRSEQVSQLLYGEKAEIIEVDEHSWARIRTDWDEYDCWCKVSQLTVVTKKEYRKATKFLAGRHGDKIVFHDSEMWLPLGSELTKSKIVSGAHTAKFKGRKLDIKKLSFDAAAIKHAALQFLHAPYQWGGRSIAGIDCSGLTQMAFKLCNKKLPRDAYQQANEGITVDFLQNAHCGDLAFFDNAEGRINHVGIVLEDQFIIHATDTSGHVVIDRIDQGGIISISKKKRTHSLRVVKRFCQ